MYFVFIYVSWEVGTNAVFQDYCSEGM